MAGNEIWAWKEQTITDFCLNLFAAWELGEDLIQGKQNPTKPKGEGASSLGDAEGTNHVKFPGNQELVSLVHFSFSAFLAERILATKNSKGAVPGTPESQGLKSSSGIFGKGGWFYFPLEFDKISLSPEKQEEKWVISC